MFESFAAGPERLVQRVVASTAWEIVIDEVQRLPALLDVVDGVIESGSGRLFVLTGSSARKLRRQGTNLLGER